jgi:hypothetical protein
MSRFALPALFVTAAGVAVAQAPQPAPQLAVARVSNNSLVWTTTVVVPVTKTVAVTVLVNGQQVVENRTVTVLETMSREQSIGLKDLRATDGAGRAIPSDRLAERLGKGAAVVLHTGPLPDAYRQILKDDAVLIQYSDRAPTKE